VGGTRSESVAKATRVAAPIHIERRGENASVAYYWNSEVKETHSRVEDVRVQHRVRLKMFVRALLVCFGIGLAGVLPDFDHLIEGMARTWHFPLVVGGWYLLWIAVALDLGYVYKHSVRTGRRLPVIRPTARRMAGTLMVVFAQSMNYSNISCNEKQ